ncbi:hypothetical protein X943_001637 [Babesia divergens]|uniref:Uncharacterized protein n=1 Tax=Babesia divergens TaxID=32595 RepID=A0AAD9G6X5_BABDI|nr:hypothetical protein X943_001637 [Babesia divergens]
MISSQLPVDTPPTSADITDVEYEVAKNQIFSEIKEVESIFKGVVARILNHLVQYMKHKLTQSYLQFYIINPLGMGMGNLLNGKLNDNYITNKLGMSPNATPKSFDMAYEEVDVPSHFGSKVTKRCWLIRSNKVDTTKAFVLMHGWFGNMQSCLHFADTLKKIGILDTHHVLIVDLHDDVGRSFESNIGLKGVTDLYDATAYLHRELGVNSISLYAQSVSGLSALMFNDVCRKACSKMSEDLDEKVTCPVAHGMDRDILANLTIDQIIIESPVANIRQHILNSPSESVKWITEQFLSSVDSDGMHVDKLSLQAFLKDPVTCSKVYIMQGSKDSITTPAMLHGEITRQTLQNPVNMFLFNDGGHANLSGTAGQEYLDTLKYVLVGRNLWEFVMGKGTKTRIFDPEDLIR